MDYGCNVSPPFYTFSPVNIHADQLGQSVNPPDGCFTLPSPEFGERHLNHPYIPPQMLYSHPFKPEYLDNNDLIPNDEIDTKIISIGTNDTITNNNFERNFVNYPLTPKTPKFLLELPLPAPPTAEIINLEPEVNAEPTIINLSQQADFCYEQGNLSQQADFCYDQGHHYLHFARPRNPPLAFENFVTAANLGSTRGKYQVAYCLQHGIGVNMDRRKAVNIYLEIINTHPQHPPSLCQLGLCFQHGIGVEFDGSRALYYYERAVSLGNSNAMFNLAYCLRHGIGTPVDCQGAFNLYLQLAELGDPQGMKFVGNCKFSGIGTPKNEMEALKWLHRASKYDFYWGGKMEYAMILLNGTATISPNCKEAHQLIKEVCENFPLCPGPNKLMLGRCYHFGIGCTPDLQKALHWYERALQSSFMLVSIVQECEQLISDIRIRHEFSTVPVVVKHEKIQMEVDRS